MDLLTFVANCDCTDVLYGTRRPPRLSDETDMQDHQNKTLDRWADRRTKAWSNW